MKPLSLFAITYIKEVSHYKTVSHQTKSHYESLLKRLQGQLNKELASAGYIAGERVIFLGRKEPSSFGTLIDRYVKEYVICPVCGSPDTRTEKNKKLGFLLCEACGARSSVKGNYA